MNDSLIENKEHVANAENLNPDSLLEREYELMDGRHTLTFYQATVGKMFEIF